MVVELAIFRWLIPPVANLSLPPRRTPGSAVVVVPGRDRSGMELLLLTSVIAFPWAEKPGGAHPLSRPCSDRSSVRHEFRSPGLPHALLNTPLQPVTHRVHTPSTPLPDFTHLERVTSPHGRQIHVQPLPSLGSARRSKRGTGVYPLVCATTFSEVLTKVARRRGPVGSIYTYKTHDKTTLSAVTRQR